MGLSKTGVRFAMVVGVLQVIFIVIIALLGKYPDKPSGFTSNNAYPNFQDVHVMVYLGFGGLMAFLKNYSFSSLGVTILLSITSVQWTAIVRGFIHNDILGGEKFPLGLGQMLTCDFSAATVLISFGVLLGKTSPVQLLVMAIFEILLAQINEYIGFDLLHVSDIGESIYIHMFGAYFGLAVTRVLYDEQVKDSSKEGSNYQSDIIAVIGSLFLWLYWPSFNGGAAGEFQERAYLNTYFSLCACTAVTFALSALVHDEGKFDMVHIQNSALAGGVAVGATANMPLEPFGAMVMGAVSAAISVLGYKYLTPFLNSKAKMHDTCGVHNLHGMPGLLAAIGAAVMAAMSDNWNGTEQYDIFPATAPSHMNATYHGATGRSAAEQGGYQFLAVIITFGFAIVGGVLVGLLLKLPIWGAPVGDSLFDDDDNWELPEEEPTVNGISAKAYKSTEPESPM